MELPQEIFDEILGHLRRDWAQDPTALSNSGLQIALTCRELYDELHPEIKAHQKAILATALETTIPERSPDAVYQHLLRLEGYVGLRSQPLTSQEFQADLHNSGAKFGIRKIDLNLYAFRGSDVDLIWSLQHLVANLHERACPLADFCLSLFWVDGVIERDARKRSRWRRSFARMLDTIISKLRCNLKMSFYGSSSEWASGYEDLGVDIAPSNAQNGPLVSRWWDFLGVGEPQEPSPESVTLDGPLTDPLFRACARRIIHQSPSLTSLFLESCSSLNHGAWDSTLSGWVLHRLRALCLRDVHIPLPILVEFIRQQPSLKWVDIERWQDSDEPKLMPHSIAKAATLSIESLFAHPLFLIAFLNANVKLPRLRSLTVTCRNGRNGSELQDEKSGGMNGVLLVLGQRQTALHLAAPLELYLSQLHNSALRSLDGICQQPHQRRQQGGRGVTEKHIALLPEGKPESEGSLGTASLADVGRAPSLAGSLQTLRCVTAFRFETWHGGKIYGVRGIDPNIIVALISALLSVETADIFTKLTTFHPNQLTRSEDQEVELWAALGEVWVKAPKLRTLCFRDWGAYPPVTWIWRRGWLQPQEKSSSDEP